MMKINLTTGGELTVGSIDLNEMRGVVRGPFGELLGFYDYRKDITTNNNGTFIMTGNKTLELILAYAEKLKNNGIEVKLCKK